MGCAFVTYREEAIWGTDRAKTAEPIELPFVMVSAWAGSENRAYQMVVLFGATCQIRLNDRVGRP